MVLTPWRRPAPTPWLERHESPLTRGRKPLTSATGSGHALVEGWCCVMDLISRETWGLVHGMGFGALFLIAFAGGLAELHLLRPTMETPSGLRISARRIGVGVTSMAVVAWATVITGTWVVYPGYREMVPTSPRSVLLADPSTDAWHTFGMEWKEHVAWLSPMLATVVAFIVVYYGSALARNDRLRRTAMTLFILAFAVAAVAGALGALITKAAPVL